MLLISTMLKTKSNSENIKPTCAANCFGGKQIGFCSNLRMFTNLSAINPKMLHFPNPNPLIAKSISKKKGMKMKLVLI